MCGWSKLLEIWKHCSPVAVKPLRLTLFIPRQVRYAGLDAYAAVLLVRHIMERMDPVFHLQPPDSADLPTGIAIRLYTGTNTRCVGEGTTADYPAETWGSTGLAIGKRRCSDRVVVELGTILVPGALANHASEDGGQVKSLETLGVKALALWDTVSQTVGLGIPFRFLRKYSQRVSSVIFKIKFPSLV